MIHFLEDHFENDEEEARKARLKYLGYELSPTGDRLVDKWERQVAKGEIPDLEEDEPLNAKIRDAKIRAAAERFYNLTGERVYIAPKPDSIAMMSGQQESAIPADDQLRDLTHLAAAGDHDALMMLAEIKDQMASPDSAFGAKPRMQLVPVDEIDQFSSASVPDSIDFENMDDVDWSQMSSVDVFRMAGGVAAGKSQPRDAFDKAQALGLFEQDDED